MGGTESWPERGVVTALEKRLQLPDMPVKGSLLLGFSTTAPTPPKSKPLFSASETPRRYRETGLLLSLSRDSRGASIAQQPGQASGQ